VNKATANDFREFGNSLRRPCIIIDRNCNASGRGQEHYVKKYTVQAHKDDANNIISNSHLVGYGYARYFKENMLKQMMQVMSEKYAGSMKGVPDLPLDGDDGNQKKRSSRKGGRGTSNKKSKDSGGSPSGAAVGAAGAAMRVLEYLKASDATDKLMKKEEQLSRDKDHAIRLAEHHQRCITHIFDLEMRFDRQGLTPEEYKEHQYYKYASYLQVLMIVR
jgi:hypothetical protein